MHYTPSTRPALSQPMHQRIEYLKALLAARHIDPRERTQLLGEIQKDIWEHLVEETEEAQVMVLDGLAALGMMEMGVD